MKQPLADGIPSVRSYMTVLESDRFKNMEAFSNQFMRQNEGILTDYGNKWVDDPLHQWSRQWEYPYVDEKVRLMARSESRLNILDAGSGITFFPYFLGAHHEHASVHCCDYDPMLAGLFERINEQQNERVLFSIADLKRLPYEKESFHMVYCISVLEHTDDYSRIIEEFHEALRPGGTLVVTFDISLDGTRDIDLEKAVALLSSLEMKFHEEERLSLHLPSRISAPDIFTSAEAEKINPDLLPWKLPPVLYRLKTFVQTGRMGTWPPSLTVFGLSLTKRSD